MRNRTLVVSPRETPPTWHRAVTACVLLLCGISFLAAGPEDARAQQHAPDTNVPPNGQLREFLETLLEESLPRTFDEEDGWGGTKEVFNGWDVDTKNAQIKTKRKWKTANHGTWKRYHLELVDPRQNLDIQIHPPQSKPDGSIDWGIVVSARIHAVAELQEWRRGVRLLGTSCEGEASIRLAWSGNLRYEWDSDQIPPDLILHPVVEQAFVELIDFDLSRISHADGPGVRGLGEGLEGLLHDRVRDQAPRLLEKSNGWIEKHPEKLRLSVQDAITDTWKDWFGGKKD